MNLRPSSPAIAGEALREIAPGRIAASHDDQSANTS